MIESGVPNLDRILGGGIPEGDVVLVTGPAGVGKTTLCFQLACQAAASGKRIAYVSTLSEPPAKLVKHLRSFSFFDERHVGKSLFLLNLYPLIKEGVEQAITALINAVEEHRASILILDGLDTVHDLQPGAGANRTFIYELAVALSSMSCTTLITSSGSLERPSSFAPELTMSDGVLVLGQTITGTRAVRTIQVQKMRGSSPLLGIHTLRLDGEGMAVYPRIESMIAPSTRGLGSERLGSGSAELDAMMAGGLMSGSVTMLAGATGTGKTLIGLQYLLEGARRGEKGLLVGFREPPRLLIDRMRRLGMDLATPVEQGLIEILHQPPVDLLADEVFARMLWNIQRFAPRRLVVDSVVELEQVVAAQERRRSVMVCMTDFIRAHEVTALLTRELSQLTGPELDFADSPLAVLGENVILLRAVELGNALYRILSILKMRDSVHDSSIRQYEIAARGFRVLPVSESTAGLLSRIARLPGESRSKLSPPASSSADPEGAAGPEGPPGEG